MLHWKRKNTLPQLALAKEAADKRTPKHQFSEKQPIDGINSEFFNAVAQQLFTSCSEKRASQPVRRQSADQRA